MACPGSRLVGKDLPVIQPGASKKKDRDEGDAAHYMAEQAFKGLMTLEELVDRKAPNNVYMTSEMFEYVEFYLKSLPEKSPTAGMEIVTNYHGEGFQVNGRADHLDFHAPTGILHIGDLKYGWGIVEPENNWVLISHAVGWCLSHPDTKPTSIVLSIYQPRPNHKDGKVRRWIISYDHLMTLCAQIFSNLSNPSNALQTGPNCKYCHALASCPAARKASLNAVDVADTAHDDKISGEQMTLELDNLRAAATRIKNRLGAIEDLMKHTLKSDPSSCPGYSIGPNYGSLKWNENVDAKLLKVITAKDLTKPKLMTPLQAVKAGVSENVVKSLSHNPYIGLKLEKVSANEKAAKMFKKGT